LGLNPYFLNTEEILDLLLGELPAGVYSQDRANNPDPTKISYSSAELRAHANLLSNFETQGQSVYNNFFITTLMSDGLSQWEKDFFGAIQDSSLTYTQRIQNLLAKYRATGGLSVPYITGIVAGILGPIGLSFAILPLSGQVNNDGNTGAWILGYSSLGLNTYLSTIDPIWCDLVGFTPLDCSLDYAAAGITALQMAEIQDVAYSYEVRIYGNADATTLALLDADLTKFEPARSTHIIMNNASPPAAPT